jgi:hypothetical protein
VNTCEICCVSTPDVRYYPDPPEYGTGGYYCGNHAACRDRTYRETARAEVALVLATASLEPSEGMPF